ncbi:unnamed protein product [Cercospora beticola]|nr:unnamed protein product [Cercospora beticola]
MKFATLPTLLFISAAAAAPADIEQRQTAHQNDSARQTVLITAVDWQRSGSTINGIRFQASIAGTSLSWRCTSDSSGTSGTSGEGFAPLKIDRCARGAPVTFAYDTTDGTRLRLWYSVNEMKSYAGSALITQGDTRDFVLPLLEVEASPTTTPPVSDEV